MKKRGALVKNIIIIAIGAAASIIFIFLYFQNQTETLKLSHDVQAKKAIVTQMQEKNSRKAEMESKLKDAEARLAEYEKKIPSNILQEENIISIRKFEAESGCKITSISYKDLRYDADHVLNTPAPDKKGTGDEKTQSASANANRAPLENEGMVLGVDIRFEGTYSQVRALIKQIEKSEVRAIIKSINTSKRAEGENAGLITGTMELGFYGIKGGPVALKDSE